ncbi:MAG: hypothetical protein JXA66_08680 [Oligoflexia bacterium]|nr:hypothetical protein [Oligoflexia bacterium]
MKIIKFLTVSEGLIIIAVIILSLLIGYSIHKPKSQNANITGKDKITYAKISPEQAINKVSDKYDLDKSMLEYKGTSEDNGFYIINLSPGESQGAAGRTFYVNPSTGETKD